mgnify:CR=1 FL=1
MNMKKIHLVYVCGVVMPDFYAHVARLRAELESIEGVCIMDHIDHPDLCIVLLDHLEIDVNKHVEEATLMYSQRGCRLWCFIPRGSRLLGDSRIARAVNAHARERQEESVQRVYPYDTYDDIRRLVLLWLADEEKKREQLPH